MTNVNLYHDRVANKLYIDAGTKQIAIDVGTDSLTATELAFIVASHTVKDIIRAVIK